MKKEYIRYKQTKKEFSKMIDHMAQLCKIPSISKFSKVNTYPFGIYFKVSKKLWFYSL